MSTSKKKENPTSLSKSERISVSTDPTEDRIIRFTVYGKLPGLNDLYRSNTRSHQAKKNNLDDIIATDIKHQLPGIRIRKTFAMLFRWYSPNKRRDQDNVEFAKKFIMDGAQLAGLIPNDNWAYAGGNTLHEHYIDPVNPRCEVVLIEGVRLKLIIE